MSETPSAGPRVGLFATCLMNVFRPNVGFSAVKLLEDAGCTVEVPASQTCCGHPGRLPLPRSERLKCPQ
jgi:L-lactate dehydrogenase complex protein LldE